LGNALRGHVRDIAADNSKLIQKAAKMTLRVLSQTTPEDETTAVSNWNVGLGKPDTKVRPAHSPTNNGLNPLQSERVTRLIGNARIRRKKVGEPVVISNDVDYIIELDDGKSNQQRKGFVGRAADAGFRELRADE
ncbi:MAG: hypothetical protein V3V10_05085, partial [Planctomycetota bacterium]